jgi:hypothetical protein
MLSDRGNTLPEAIETLEIEDAEADQRVGGWLVGHKMSCKKVANDELTERSLEQRSGDATAAQCLRRPRDNNTGLLVS